MEPKPGVLALWRLGQHQPSTDGATDWRQRQALTVPQTAKALQVSRDKVLRLIREGDLAAAEVAPRHWRIDPAAIGRFLEGGER
jgi:excisionase family DNA binding protein